MKILKWTMAGLLAVNLVSTAKGDEMGLRGQLVEIPVERAYIPKMGYDDNDHIQAIVTGELPNPCYTLGATYTEMAPDAKTVKIHQMAWRQMVGPCASSDLIEDPVPFTSEVNVGTLGAALYNLQFKDSLNNVKARPFLVEKAKTQTIDNAEYAVVNNVDLDSIVKMGDEVSVTLTGLLTSRCSRIDSVKVVREDDVLVVLPVVRNKIDLSPTERCERVNVQFKEKVSLGLFKSGEYLLHVRSREGKAVNRVFNVVALPPTL